LMIVVVVVDFSSLSLIVVVKGSSLSSLSLLKVVIVIGVTPLGDQTNLQVNWLLSIRSLE